MMVWTDRIMTFMNTGKTFGSHTSVELLDQPSDSKPFDRNPTTWSWYKHHYCLYLNMYV